MLQRNNNSSGLRKSTSDPDENKTWNVAKKLGVAQELSLASEDVKRDFANGVKNAAMELSTVNTLKNICHISE